MTFTEIFEAYYNLYRNEATTPASTDDEWTVAMRLANEALSRWEHYDHTYWRELFTTLTLSGETTTLSTGVSEYDAPDDFREAGGFVKVYNSTGSKMGSYRILEPEQVQFQGEDATYAYFTGDPNNGYTLHLNPAVTTTFNGYTIDYPYYKKATTFTAAGDTSEIPDPYFLVHRMLSNRFRGSRNPYAADAKKDAEDALKTMQLANIAGNWANPWSLPDNSGSVWGF